MITRKYHSRHHPQLRSHNSKHRHTNKSAKHNTATTILTRYQVSSTLFNRASWTRKHALTSDHLSIITTTNTKQQYKPQQQIRRLINYIKRDSTQFTKTRRLFSQIYHIPLTYIQLTQYSQTLYSKQPNITSQKAICTPHLPEHTTTNI